MPIAKPNFGNRPKLVNGGAAGLLKKLPKGGEAEAPKVDEIQRKVLSIDSIFVDGSVVPISELIPDPLNARLHPDRNLKSIMESLGEFGQLKAIVVRKQTMVVVAGNGTLEAAKKLGWTKLACNVREMTDLEAASFGLADNRTAELAQWDEEMLAKVNKLIEEAKSAPIGWTIDELMVLRNSNLIETAQAPGDFNSVGEDIEVEHVCPKCGYQFSGGETKKKASVLEASEAED